MKTIIRLVTILSLISLSYSLQAQTEFRTLFNGRDLGNWVPEKPGGFEVIDGELITRSFGSGNDIYSDKAYSNFILQLEFLLSEVGNSGVFIRRDPADSGSGFEVQLLAPWTPWRDDLHCTGSLYGHVAVTDRPDETTGVWYKMEIRCDRNIVSVSVNDKITTIADIDTVKTLSGKPVSGLIGFQGNHAEKDGQYAKFRNILIYDLDSDPGYVLRGTGLKNDLWRSQSLDAAVDLGAQIVSPLAGLMTDGDPVAKSVARQALFDIAAKASDPGASPVQKKEVRSAIKKSIRSNKSPITADYLRWIAGMIGKTH